MNDRFLTNQSACRIKQSILSGYGDFHKTLRFFLCTFLKLSQISKKETQYCYDFQKFITVIHR